MIEVDVPNREVTNVLPRHIMEVLVNQLFNAEGYQFREPDRLAFRVSVDDYDSVRITISEPVLAAAQGKWIEGTSKMAFELTDLQFQLQGGNQWPLIPLESSSSQQSSPQGLQLSRPTGSHVSEVTAQQFENNLPRGEAHRLIPAPRPRESRSILLD